MTRGKVIELEWRNGCIDCDGFNCYDTSINRGLADEVKESNCVLPYNYCNSTLDECDTQVFLTFKGRDLHDRTCLSENYDLIGFSDFNEKSMFQSLL